MRLSLVELAVIVMSNIRNTSHVLNLNHGIQHGAARCYALFDLFEAALRGLVVQVDVRVKLLRLVP